MKYSKIFVWLLGIKAYDSVKEILMRKSLLKDIQKLSPDAETSCLEGFHSTQNYWHPKMMLFMAWNLLQVSKNVKPLNEKSLSHNKYFLFVKLHVMLSLIGMSWQACISMRM